MADRRRHEPAARSAAAAQIVIADTSPVRIFVEAGAQRAFAAYLGERVLITLDVARELEEACVFVPGLRAFLGTWPAAQAPVDLPAALKLKAADILGFVADDPRASLQDLGEVASVLMAQHLRDVGQYHCRRSSNSLA